MKFKHRYVRFGTTFSSEAGTREAATSKPPADVPESDQRLFENELVVDVGGVCWGVAGETRRVIDHHFFRPDGQFPSASAAVLHQAGLIWSAFGARADAPETVWLVTHREPDYDAYCAKYLAQSIVNGTIPHDGWDRCGLPPDRWGAPPHDGAPWIDWLKPDVSRIACEPTRKSAVLLAASASYVDNARRFACPRNRAAHAVLQAAVVRGRPFLANGADILFDEMRRAIEERGMNPLFDSLLDGSAEFAPELALLDAQTDAYARDIKRSRRAIVNVKRADQSFRSWFDVVKERPLLDAAMAVQPPHSLAPHATVQMDGVYLRDPECLLFKEWAREDTVSSSAGHGFRFTAIAYSGGMSNGLLNRTRYIFAIDPEWADGCHLYDLWARLEQEEIKALHDPAWSELRTQLQTARAEANARHEETGRIGFLPRADSLAALFDDPWYDGQNYQCTIVDTPNRGTLIGRPGHRGDLADDPVAQVVQEMLELSSFVSDAAVVDVPATIADAERTRQTTPLAAAASLPPPHGGYFRIGSIALNKDLNVMHGMIAEQIGRALWPLLSRDVRPDVPRDFVERHLIRNAEWIGVWNRRGAVIAYKPAAADVARRFEDLFKTMASLTRSLTPLMAADQASQPELTVASAEQLVRQVAELKHQLVLPDNRLPALFFEATKLDEVLDMIRTINVSAVNRAEERRSRNLAEQVAANVEVVTRVQTVLEWIEVFLISVYAGHLWHMFATENEGFKHLIERTDWQLGGWAISVGVILFACMSGLALIKPWKHDVAGRSNATPRATEGGDKALERCQLYPGTDSAISGLK